MSKKKGSITNTKGLDALFQKPDISNDSNTSQSSERDKENTTLTIYADQNYWLDEMRLTIKRTGNRKISKSILIRAMLDTIKIHANELDLDQVQSEDDVRARLEAALNIN